MSLTLVLGGTRSGKSRRGEALVLATGRGVRYVATADASDPGMAARIDAHAARRPADWITVEAGERLADVIEGCEQHCVLVDGLGLWIARLLDRADPAVAVERELSRVVAAARGGTAVVVVAEQAGEGLLPADALSRTWLDLLGAATERLAAAADHVELVVAGQPLVLKNGVVGPGARHHGDQDVREGEADHAVNVLAGGPPAWLRELLADALDDARRYPHESAAVDALAALHGRGPEEVVPLAGATEGFWLLPAALRPALVACIHPAFAEGEAAMRAHGVAVVRVATEPDDDFALDPTAVPEAADVVIVSNPSSPAGTLTRAAALLALRRPGRIVVVDEAFMDLVPGQPSSLAADPLDDVIVLRSITKALAIPGVRAGYALAAPAVAERLRQVRPPWSVNAFALAALVGAALHPAELAAAAERAQAERGDLEGRLDEIGAVRRWPAAANFVLVEVPGGAEVAAALRSEGIAVRVASTFPGLTANHLRLTARAPAQNARLVDALARVLSRVEVLA